MMKAELRKSGLALTSRCSLDNPNMYINIKMRIPNMYIKMKMCIYVFMYMMKAELRNSGCALTSRCSLVNSNVYVCIYAYIYIYIYISIYLSIYLFYSHDEGRVAKQRMGVHEQMFPVAPGELDHVRREVAVGVLILIPEGSDLNSAVGRCLPARAEKRGARPEK